MSVWTYKKTLTLKAFCLFKHFELIAFFSFSFLFSFFLSVRTLKNRVQRVFIRGFYSSQGTVKYGVPQGSVLGPVLFCIYINDLPLHIPSNSAECHMLADDTSLHTIKFKRCYSFVLIVFQGGASLITRSFILLKQIQ